MFRNDPLFLPTLCFVLGLTLGNFLPFLGFIPVWCVVLAVILIVLSRQAKFADPSTTFIVRGLLHWLTFVLVGLFLMQHTVYSQPENSVLHVVNNNTWNTVGTVCSDPKIHANNVSVLLDDVSLKVEGQYQQKEGRIRLSVPFRNDGEGEKVIENLRRGNTVQFWSRFRKFNNHRNLTQFSAHLYYASKGIFAWCYAKSPAQIQVISHVEPGFVSKVISAYRSKLLRTLHIWQNQHEFNPDYKRSTAFVQALLLGQKTELDYEIREEFKKTGLYHILAISGLHVGILAGIFYLPLLVLIKHSIRIRAAVLMSVIIFYALLTEGQPSVMRATIMLLVYLGGLLFFRESRFLNTISFTALILLSYQPLYLLQTGFQLTFLAVLSIYFLGAGIQKNLLPTFSRTFFGNVLSLSLAVQLGLAPILAYMFGLVPVLSFIPFLIVLPLLTIILFSGFVLIVTVIFSSTAALVVLPVVHQCVLLLLDVIHHFSHIPGNTVTVRSPSIIVIVLYYLLLVLGTYPFLKTRLFRPIRYVLLSVLLIFFLLPIVRERVSPTLEVNFLDVGDGDAILFRFPNGDSMLIDGGGVEDNTFDTARYIMKPFFIKKGLSQLGSVLPTHAHADHLNGIINLIDSFPVQLAYVGYRTHTPQLYKVYFETLRKHAVRTLPLLPPFEHNLLTIYENNNSVILRVTYGSFSVLTTGDIEKEGEESLTRYGPYLDATVLKVAHHGSATSSLASFLDLVRAQIAVISVSRENVHGHPHTEVLQRLWRRNCRTFSTGNRGVITITTDGSRYMLEGNGKKLIDWTPVNN